MEYIKGRITSREKEHFIFECNQIGYKIFGNANKIKNNIVFIYITYDQHLNQKHIFGFNNKEEKDYFLVLLKIKGIGPFSISKIMSNYSIAEIEKVRNSGNYLLLSDCKVKNNILAKIVYKKVDLSKTNLIVINATLTKLGFKKADVDKALKKIYKKPMALDVLIPKVIREINAFK